MNRPAKKPTNLSISSELLAEAKELNVNLSRAAESGVKSAVQAAKAKKWMNDNRAALESSNAYIEKYGLPLDQFRPF